MAYVAPSDFRAGSLQWFTAGLALTTGEASDNLIESCAKRAKELIDRYTGDEFEPTEETLILSGEGTSILRVPRRIRTISSVSILRGDGSWSEVDEADYVVSASLDEEGTIRTADLDYIAVAYGRTLDPLSGPYAPNEWSDSRLNPVFGTAFPRGFQNISIDGEFGWNETPEGIKRASALLVYDLLKPKNNDLLRRADSYQTDDASFTIAKTEPTGLPEVDAILVEYAYPRVF